MKKKWTYDTCKSIASEFTTVKDFRCKYKGAYSAALRNGWLNDYEWLKRCRNHGYWTYEKCYEEAKKYLYVTFILYAFLTDYQEFYNAVISKITNPYAFEASAAKYYYRILEHSDIKPDDYIYWYQPQEMMLYNYKNTLHLNNIQEQNLPWPFLKKIPQGKNIFIYLTKEYYSDYEEEYKFADNFVKNECSVIYTIDDDMGSGKGQVIKCNKITPAETEE